MKGYWYVLAVAMLVGIGTALSNGYLFIILLLIWLSYLYFFSNIDKKVVLFALLFFSLSFYLFNKKELEADDLFLDKTNFIGDVISPLKQTENKYEFTFNEKANNINILVKIFNNDDELHNMSHVKYGATCLIQGELSIPTKATNPGQFDYKNYLNQKGISYELIINSPNDAVCEGEKLLQHIYEFRQSMIEIINSKLSEETAQWIIALVFGDSSFIDENTIRLFQRWGLSHILAISGLHTGIVIAIIYFLLVRLLITTKEKAQIMIIIFLPFFALATGGEPSVWRASLMVLLLLLLNRLKLFYYMLDILSIVFISLIIYDKQIIYHIGFQFSFLVTFGLLLSSQLLKQSQSRLYQAFLISFVAQMIILPMQLHYFYTFQPLSIILNILVIPYFSLFVIPLMFFLLFALLLPQPLLQLIDYAFDQIHEIFLMFLQGFNHIFDYPFLIGDINVSYFAIYYVLFFIFMKLLEQQKLKKSFLIGLCLTFSLYGLVLRHYVSPIGTVTMLDMGQGDAFIVELPYRKGVFMIDAGSTVTYPDFDLNDYVYESIIRPYLDQKSIYKIDGLFLSHEHIDHYGSVPFLVKDKKVDEVLISPYFVWEDDLYDQVINHDVKVTTIKQNEKITLKDHSFYVLGPEVDFNSANDNSLVLYTKLGTKSWLFTGDIEKQAELALIKSIDQLNVDVLKVGHHGSKTSSNEQFIKKVQPQYALISVGVKNRYGHPAKEVLDLLNDENITIFRTDIDGAVQYFYNENQTIFKRYNDTK